MIEHLQRNSQIHKHKNFNKLFIVFVCMFLQAIPFGIAENIQPLFIPYVIKGYGFSLASFSLLFTIGAIASSVASPFIGKLFGKLPIKLIFICGAIISGLGFIGYGFAQNLTEFYIFSAITQIGTVTFSSLGIPYLINNWFPTGDKGVALGTAFAGGSIGNIFLQQIVSQLLVAKGYSFSYILFGIISLACSLPIIILFVKLPKGEQNGGSDSKMESQKAISSGPGAKATRKNKLFWIFGLGYLIIGISISALSTQYANYFTGHLKFTAIMVGSIGSVFAFCSLFGNVIGGALFDKIGTFKTMAIAFIFQVIAILALLFCTDVYWLAFIFAVAFGFNVFSYMAAPAFMTQDLFGKKESSETLGVVSLMFAVGFAAGSAIFGLLVDKFGFELSWSSILGFTVIGYTLLLLAIKLLKRQNFALIKYNDKLSV